VIDRQKHTVDESRIMEAGFIFSCLKGSGFSYWVKSATLSYVFLVEVYSGGYLVYPALP
jgi:hypothetical protein